MAHITMNEIIHAAVRRDLRGSRRRSVPSRDGDAERPTGSSGPGRRCGRCCTSTTRRGRARLAVPAVPLGTVDPALADAMEAEHEAMAHAMTDATAAVYDLAATPTTAAAQVAADRVARAAEVTAHHLDHEEREVMPIIVPQLGTPAWKAVEKQLRAGSLTQGGRFFAWLQDGIEPELGAALRTNVPGPVLWGLSRLAGRSYHRHVAPVWR